MMQFAIYPWQSVAGAWGDSGLAWVEFFIGFLLLFRDHLIPFAKVFDFQEVTLLM